MRNLLIGLGVLVVVLIGVFFLFQPGGSLVYEAAVGEDNAVLLVDQPSANEVVVSYAKISKPGYILVHAVNPSTGQIEVVGSSALLPAGEHKNVRVTTRSRLGTNEKLARLRASIVADNGDGQYSTSDTEVLVEADENSEAEIDPNAADPEDLSGEELAGLLEDAGYTVDDAAAETIEELEDSELTDGGSPVDEIDEGGEAGTSTSSEQTEETTP